jgi:hypothetical protein
MGQIALSFQLVLGVLYRTFASWRIYGNRSSRGITAAALLALLTLFSIGIPVRLVSPGVIDEWLSWRCSWSFVPLAPIAAFVMIFFQYDDRGWRWAAEAEQKAPRLVKNGQTLAVSVYLVVIGLQFVRI